MRLIDADAELRALERMVVEGEVNTTAVNFAKIILRKAPTVDAVKVVRCYECKYMMPNGRCAEFADPEARPSAGDYCSYAERRKKNE